MPRLPDIDSLGARPVPRSRRQIAAARETGAVANAVGEVGALLAREGEQLLQKQDALEYSTARSTFMAKRLELDQQYSTDTDYATIEQRYGDELNVARDQAASSIKSARIRRHFMADSADDYMRGVIGARATAVSGLRDVGVATLNRTIDQNERSYSVAANPEDRASIRTNSLGAVSHAAEMKYITAAEAEKSRQAIIENYPVRRAQALLADGKLDEAKVAVEESKAEIGADKLLTLQNAIYAEERRRTAAEQHQLALGKQQASEALATVSARVEAGDTPDDAQFESVQRQLQAVGDESGLVRVTRMRIGAAVNRETQTWTPQQYRSRIDALTAKGDRRSTAEGMELDQLKTIAPGRISAFNRDPGNIAALSGHPRPPLNFDDPASLEANRQWRGYVAQTFGRQPPIIAPEALPTLQQEANGPPAEKIALAEKLSRLGPIDGTKAAREIAPGNPLFVRLVTVGKNDRAAAINGAEARKTHPRLVDGTAAALARDAFDSHVGAAFKLMPQGDVGGLFDIARNVYANDATTRGVTEWESDDAFAPFIDRAFGGARNANGQQVGGIGRVNGNPVLLPRRLTQDQFESTLARIRFPKDGEFAPRWRDGREMTLAEFRRFTPVARPDGRYEFHNSRGEAALAKNGGVLAIDVASVAKRLGY